MKKFIFLPLFFLAVFGCTKDPGGSTPIVNSSENTEVAADRGPNCNNCEIRINDPLYENGYYSHEFRVYENFITQIWQGHFKANACGGKTIIPGVWYPITLLDNVQYHLTYTYRRPCTTLQPMNAPFSIRVVSNYVKTFYLSTGNTPATNPDVVYFYKTGCTVSEGQLSIR